MKLRESRVERRFVDSVENMGGIAIKIKIRDWPDRLVLFPKGVHFFVELKAPGEKPTLQQETMHEILREMGHEVYVVDGSDWKSVGLLLMRQWGKVQQRAR